MDILIQVNTSQEESKFGCKPEEALALTEKIAKLPCLKIKGLMTIGLFSDDMDKVRLCFKLLQKIRQERNNRKKHSQCFDGGCFYGNDGRS